MQHVMLKSGVLIAFEMNKVPFTFNEEGFFVNDVYLSLDCNTDKFRKVESFTFHISEMSCHWVK